MIELEQAALDYLSLTTFNKTIADNWRVVASKMLNGNGTMRGRKHLQYEGWQFQFAAGTLYWGKAEQRKKGGGAAHSHYLMMLTGRLADYARDGMGAYEPFEIFGYDALNPAVNCTRIDLQCTAYNPEILIDGSSRNWQWAMLNHIDELGKIVSWMESDGQWGRLATVGVNSRKGAVYHRIYAKAGELGDVIRFETEYTKPTSQRVATAVFNPNRKSEEVVAGLIKKQLYRMKYKPLERLFSCLDDYAQEKIPPAMRSGASGTELWLLGTALPALKKALATGENQELLGAAFGEAIDGWYVSTIPNWRDLPIAAGDGKHAI